MSNSSNRQSDINTFLTIIEQQNNTIALLTKNGEGDLVVMDIETFERREKMLKLREELLAVEEDRLAGRTGYTLDELETHLNQVLGED